MSYCLVDNYIKLRIPPTTGNLYEGAQRGQKISPLKITFLMSPVSTVKLSYTVTDPGEHLMFDPTIQWLFCECNICTNSPSCGVEVVLMVSSNPQVSGNVLRGC